MRRLGGRLLPLAACGATLWLVLALVLPRVVRFDPWVGRLESGSARFLGAPVSLGPARLSLWTGPALQVGGVRVGEPAAAADGEAPPPLEASGLTLRPSLLALLRGKLEPRRVSFRGLRLLASGVPVVVDGWGRLRLRGARCGSSFEGEAWGILAAFESRPEGEIELAGRLAADGFVVESARVGAGPVEVRLSGTVEGIRGWRPRAELETRARFGRTSAEGRVGFRSAGGRPELEFELRSELVDLDQVLRDLASGAPRPRPARSWLFQESRAADSGGAFPRASLLAAVAARGTVNVALARVAGLSFGGVESRVGLDGGRLAFDGLVFDAYRGRGRGRLEVDLAGAGAPFELRAGVERVDVRALCSAAGVGATWLEGEGSLDLAISGDGLSAGRPRVRAGAARVTVRHGRLRGVGLLGQVLSALDLVAGRSTGRDETPFETLSAGFEIERGIAATRDLVFRSEQVALEGRGSVGLDGSLAFETVARFSPEVTAEMIRRVPALRFRVGRDDRLEVPLQIGGTMRSPRVRLDLDRILEEGLERAHRNPSERALLESLVRREGR